jgi:hypothetical protein
MKTFHILDPFTEQELLLPPFSKRQSKKEDLRRIQTRNARQRNCITSLLYCSRNIENAFHDATIEPNDGIGEIYVPYDGMPYRYVPIGRIRQQRKNVFEMFPKLRTCTKTKAPLRVDSPPYSIGQKFSQ